MIVMNLSIPIADEYCDETDNDCDDQVDEEDAVDQSVFYLDEDGDGSGVVDFIKSPALYQMAMPKTPMIAMIQIHF